jgi:hypothetical protein
MANTNGIIIPMENMEELKVENRNFIQELVAGWQKEK